MKGVKDMKATATFMSSIHFTSFYFLILPVTSNRR